MFRFALMLAVAIFAIAPTPTFAADNEFKSMIDDIVGVDDTELATVESSSRLDDIERRIEELERTSIDAKEAEEIAERVVQRYVKQLRLAINTPTGGQRIETVNFQSPTDVKQFQLGPGETLSSYTDPYSGNIVKIGAPTTQVVSTSFSEPVPTWSTSEVVIQSQPAPVTTYRTYAMRPRLQTFTSSTPTSTARTTYRRGLFGRQIARTVASPNATCRMVNGRVVCN